MARLKWKAGGVILHLLKHLETQLLKCGRCRYARYLRFPLIKNHYEKRHKEVPRLAFKVS